MRFEQSLKKPFMRWAEIEIRIENVHFACIPQVKQIGSHCFSTKLNL